MVNYNEYKDVKMGWLDRIPAHWTTVPLKYSIGKNPFSFVDGDWIESKVIESDGIRYLTTGNVGVINYKEQGNGFISDKTFKELNCTEVFPGDVLISRLNFPIGRSCIVPNLGYRIVVAVDNVIFRPDETKYNKKYLVYQMNCYPYSENANFIARGSTMQRITRAQLGALKLCVPPLEEQNAMVTYLDKKCSEIDNVISAQQKRIALLQELKQSVITHAVTKGLDPNVVMKDSGVKWIGKSPLSWKYCRLKDFLKLKTDVSESLVKIGLENIESKTGKFIETSTEFEGNGVAFSKRNIVYGKLRPYLQKVWLAEFDGNAVGDFFVFESKKNAIPTFIKYLMLSDGFTKEADGSTVGAKMPRVSSSFILTMHYCLPSIEEQQAIVEYLTKRCNSLDIALSKAQYQVELLQEYKQSLITEVVTGKRKVC